MLTRKNFQLHRRDETTLPPDLVGLQFDSNHLS